ncbi:hypothetical protein GvMRE_IIg540 [endosymbiont GvMRE of Glomus versiforme]|nr:hypothetical protein GvMRE_IIg540 [endosymbiont GvMRE of Glomus versiforme]
MFCSLLDKFACWIWRSLESSFNKFSFSFWTWVNCLVKFSLSFFKLIIICSCALFSLLDASNKELTWLIYCSNCLTLDCKSFFLAIKNSCGEFLGLFSIKRLIFSLFSFPGSFGNSRDLFLTGFGGNFPTSHLSLITFSFGSSLFFQYEAVVLIEECPKTFCDIGKGTPFTTWWVAKHTNSV